MDPKAAGQVNVFKLPGSGLIGSHGAGGGGAGCTTFGLLQRLSGDSVRILLTFRSSARRRERGVTGGCASCVGGVFNES